MNFAMLPFLTLAARGPLADSQDGSAHTVALYRRAKDSVVQIEVTTRDGMAYGTGFFFGDSQTVATCHHVIDGATKILIHGTRGARWIPVSMSFDRSGDTALLHLAAKTQRPPLSGARAAEIGQYVYVIGNPLGLLTGSLSTGIVSANRRIESLPLIQTTAPISEGSSGSPVLDRRGRVLGMVSFTFSEGQNLNMAIGAEVLRWVRADRREIGLPAYYAANASGGGAAMRIAPPAPTPAPGRATADRTEAEARGAFLAQIARYDGRVIDAFVRWQVAEVMAARGEGGVTAADTNRMYDAFRAAVSEPNQDQAMARLATAAGQTDYYGRVQVAAQSLLHVAEDKARQERELLRTLTVPAGQGREQSEYGRLVEALCNFGAASEDESWISAETLYANFPTSAKGECIMLAQNAFVDPDLPRRTTLREVRTGSAFRAGDEVRGARMVGDVNWTKIDTWEDLWQFTADHPHLCRIGWEVCVMRDGSPVSVSMCPATAKK